MGVCAVMGIRDEKNYKKNEGANLVLTVSLKTRFQYVK
jgi:hypothetical protein